VRGVPLNAQGYFFSRSGPTSIHAVRPEVFWIGTFSSECWRWRRWRCMARTTSPSRPRIGQRCRRLARRAWVATAILTVLTTVATFAIKRPC
jgi:hypothetical protein